MVNFSRTKPRGPYNRNPVYMLDGNWELWDRRKQINPFTPSVSRARVSFRLGLKKARALNTISGRVSAAAAHKAQSAAATAGSEDGVGVSGAAVELHDKV